MDHDSMEHSPAPRPLCRCKKQRTDRGSPLGAARLGLYGRTGFSAAEIRFRERQRQELGIERFRRVGLCTEESDAATLPPGDVLPRTDADAASDVASDAGTLRPGDVLPRTDADTASDVASDAGTLWPGDVLPRTDADAASDVASDAGTLRPGDVLPRTDADTASDVASDAGTLWPGDVLPRTDADTASDVASDAGTLRPGDVLPRTDADTASDVASDAGTLWPGDVLPRTDADAAAGVASAVAKPIPLRPVSGPSGTRCGRRRGSRPLCGCKKQRTDRGSRLGGARLGLYSRTGFSAAEIRFRVRQRRELGIERFRRVGLCTEESDAATLPPGDVLPRTDADAAAGVASAVAKPIPLRPVSGPSGTRCGRRRGSRPLCRCKKQRTDRGSRLGGARLGLYSRTGFSAAEIRFRVRQRRELGIERFRRVGLCTEESDAGTLQPSDVLPRTDADAAAGVASAVAKPIPLRPVSGPSGTRCRRRRGSRPLCRCKKQRKSGVKRRRVRRRRYRGRRIMCTEGSHCRDRRVPFILARLLRDTLSSEASGAAMLPHSHCPLCAQLDQAFAALSLDEEEPLPPLPTSYIHCLPPIVAYTFTGVDAARTPSVSLFRF
nr:unnamed protein product [Leishmania braziliensis]